MHYEHEAIKDKLTYLLVNYTSLVLKSLTSSRQCRMIRFVGAQVSTSLVLKSLTSSRQCRMIRMDKAYRETGLALTLKDKISEDDKKKVLDKCQETLSWLYANQTAEKEEFEHHQKELEAICNTINLKPYWFNIKQPMDDKTCA
ncbi:unnamed protein product [Meloidogyne enterolobii]|uniref:Uncharacterized protein n=1 Tax=Meloidogyne enterolobii TaxID=390850 RepID=A0ACB0YW45_MELEN